MQSTSCEMLSWMKHKLESRWLGEISVSSDKQMTLPLWQKANKNQRAFWWKWKKRVKKVGLKLNIEKTKIMASGPIASWQIDGETMEIVTDFIVFFSFLLQNHCRCWLQPWNWNILVLWNKSCDQTIQHIKEQRHYFANTGTSSQSFGFSKVVMYSWVLMNWSFLTVVLEKTLFFFF